MVPQPRPLIEVLAEIPDFRHNRRKRHPLAAILALACSAMLCGYRSYMAIAEWGRNYGVCLTWALGVTRRSPCTATLHIVLRRVDRAAMEAQLGAWLRARWRERARPRTLRRVWPSMARRCGGARSRGPRGCTCSRPLLIA